ncbi:hypothetical protein EDD18DRAFT_1101462 [Armillaria luteobubalina]|uniref:Uncharacterized protein n=1 Tax=Armillaria luteobubalina TaxID=153913 RepID=A0AA39QG08_9AGAR|nr:hypothetical protein EDD18DRAFT_1101462 [Armillaria luteobubalina]
MRLRAVFCSSSPLSYLNKVLGHYAYNRRLSSKEIVQDVFNKNKNSLLWGIIPNDVIVKGVDVGREDSVAVHGLINLSFSLSDNKHKKRLPNQYPILEDVNINLKGTCDSSSRLVTHREPVKYWYNIIIDPMIWAATFSDTCSTRLTPLPNLLTTQRAHRCLLLSDTNLSEAVTQGLRSPCRGGNHVHEGITKTAPKSGTALTDSFTSR